MNRHDVDVVIVTYNSGAFVEACLDSLLDSNGVSNEITVVDNASTDNTAELIEEEYPSVRVVRNAENVGYARAVNKGIASADGSAFTIIANADVVFHNDTARQMVEYLMTHRDVGVVGPQQVFPNGKWQRSYGNVPGIRDSIKNVMGITSFHNWIRRSAWPQRIDRHPQETGYIDGAAMAMRKEAYESVGGFDERFFFYGEEADFCFRLRKSGWRVVFLPSASLIHLRGGSSRRLDASTEKYLRLHVDSKLLLFDKHYARWQLRYYVRLEKMHAQKLTLVYHVIRYLSSKPKSDHALRLAMEHSFLARVWNEKLV